MPLYAIRYTLYAIRTPPFKSLERLAGEREREREREREGESERARERELLGVVLMSGHPTLKGTPPVFHSRIVPVCPAAVPVLLVHSRHRAVDHDEPDLDQAALCCPFPRRSDESS
jgi:hypothetical protein